MPETEKKTKGRLAPPEIARIAEAHFGVAVDRITAPGGRTRDSLRLLLADGRTVIATQRKTRHRHETERLVLETLAAAGAPVPAWLGERDGLLFQGDAGSARLTAQIERLPDERVREVVAAAFAALWGLKRAADETGLTEKLPALAMSARFLTPFCAMPARLSRALDLPPTGLDVAAVAQVLAVTPARFVKWDARPGNAGVQRDGGVVWFDWEHAGRRGGAEDFAFLAGDEFWTLGADPTLELFARSSPEVTPGMLRLFTAFSVLHAAQRLRLVLNRVRRSGWIEAEVATRYDRVGTVPGFVERLCRHGADLASREATVRPLADWFPRVAEAVVKEKRIRA